MKYLNVTFAVLLFVLNAHFVSAQAWKPVEQKIAINQEADIKKRMISIERDLATAKDAEMLKIHEERLSVIKSAEESLNKYKAKIDAGDKTNSLRYREITSIKLRRLEAMLNLVTLRVAEMAYETFGVELKDEMLSVYKELRQDHYAVLKSYDEAVSKIESKIQ